MGRKERNMERKFKDLEESELEKVKEKGTEEEEQQEEEEEEEEEAKEAREKGEAHVGGSETQLNKDTSNDEDDEDDEDDSRALQPEKMFFEPSEYTKSVRISSRCNVGEALTFLAEYPTELKWLSQNDQFKHIFHMPVEHNHQVQGMWMLMVRTVKTDSKRDCWFVVNGRLIRYSFWEHALLTGLNCKEYANHWKKLGSLNFSERVFKKPKGKGVKLSDVKNKLETMKKKKGASADSMRLAVLYFLVNVLVAKNKYDPSIDEFLLRIVDDLSICEKFPWGRYTFEDCVDGIKTVVSNMGGEVKGQPGYSGFIIPPQILAFECIPILGRKFREDVKVAPGCPRMCKRKFVK